MNNCTIVGTVIENPNLSESDFDTTATVLVKFHSPYENKDGYRSESILQIFGWGELAQIIAFLKDGDRFLVSGRLKTDSVERVEGIREKKIELIAHQIYPLP